MSLNHLAIYLNDHLAGATAAVELLGHLEQKTNAIGPFAARLRQDIVADRDELAALMRSVKIPVSTTRKAGGWLSEKLAELKVHFDDPSDGSLRLLEMLEAIAVGIEGKRALWTALTVAAEAAPELLILNYARLLGRVDEQRMQVEAQRLIAARAALGTIEHAPR